MLIPLDDDGKDGEGPIRALEIRTGSGVGIAQAHIAVPGSILTFLTLTLPLIGAHAQMSPPFSPTSESRILLWSLITLIRAHMTVIVLIHLTDFFEKALPNQGFDSPFLLPHYASSARYLSAVCASMVSLHGLWGLS